MGTTASGLVYPDATDAPDVPADLQAAMESVDSVYGDGGSWSSSTSGFTAASNWTLTNVLWRIVGPIVSLRVTAARTTSAITVPTNGDISPNVDVLSAIPAALIPAQQQALGAYGTGRLVAGFVTSGGVLTLSAAAPGSNISTSESISFGGLYLLG